MEKDNNSSLSEGLDKKAEAETSAAVEEKPKLTLSGVPSESLVKETLDQSHPVLSPFYDEILKQCQEHGIDFDTVISFRAHNDVYRIAQTVDALSTINPRFRIEQLKAMMQGWDQSVELQGDPQKHEGFYTRLCKVHVREGEKPGMLVFAILPKGHCAPTHIHKSPEGTHLPGEITATLRGTLRYFDETSHVLTHQRDDTPRISESGSKDEYLIQTDDWMGFYIEFAPCERVEE